MTDADLRDQAVQHLKLTTVGYKNKQWTVPPAGTQWKQALDLLAQIGAPTPPPPGWVVAPPQPPVTTISNPAGVGVNLYNSSSPRVVEDTVVQGGGDSAYLIQPGAPNRTIQRCQALNVAAGNAVTYGKHAVYAKAPGVLVEDFTATASRYAANGLSVRFGGFLGQRCQLDGFPIPLAIFADDTTPNLVTWFDIAGAFTDTGIWLDCDEAPKMVYTVVAENVALTGNGKFLAANTANFAGRVSISSCTLNGKPVTAADVSGVPASALTIT